MATGETIPEELAAATAAARAETEHGAAPSQIHINPHTDGSSISVPVTQHIMSGFQEKLHSMLKDKKRHSVTRKSFRARLRENTDFAIIRQGIYNNYD